MTQASRKPVDLGQDHSGGSLGTPVNAYLRTRVLTASPEELRLLLLDGAIKFALQGREGLTTKNYELSFGGISQCREIVLELLTTIKSEPNPELANNVRAVYTFLYTELTTVNHERNVEGLDKVIQILEYERETWVMLMQKLAEERAAAAPVGSIAPSETRQSPGRTERAPLSVSA
jgi:flagellar secretion chaperone FliS